MGPERGAGGEVPSLKCYFHIKINFNILTRILN